MMHILNVHNIINFGNMHDIMADRRDFAKGVGGGVCVKGGRGVRRDIE